MNRYSKDEQGYTFRWTARRSEVDCDVFLNGELVAELCYPKLFGSNMPATHDAFWREALGIAKESNK